MNKFIRYIFRFVLIFCVIQPGKSQVISGVINRYAKVDSVIGMDKVRVESIAGFSIGDTVLLVQMKGAHYKEDVPRYIDHMKGAGKYEFIGINYINPVTRIIEFRSNFINHYINDDSLLNYKAGECLQIVRVPTYNKVTVGAGGLTCDPWDGNKGGIVTFIVNDTLILNDSINANKKGFIGGAYTQNNGYCPSTQGLFDYLKTKIDSAGLKGEGVVSNSQLNTRGRGNYGNAGGGGYGRYSGGGGGGNYGSGTVGGKMDTICTDLNSNSGGEGGNLSNNYFGLFPSDNRLGNRIFMGGAGGAGTGSAANDGTKGGNGGGIVFIIARNLITNNKCIAARGESVETTATNSAGAGGGGAGGTILLAVDNYLGPLNIHVPGGKGGNSSACSGYGGGGGGGFVSLSAVNPLPVFSTLNHYGGKMGTNPCGGIVFSGTPGDTIFNFNPVLNGFLFNLIKSSQKICYGEIPATIIGTKPRGGDGKYRYQWQKRKWNTTSWINIPNTNTINYASPQLFDSTEFRRVVKVYQPQWNDSVSDTSKFILISVIPEIKTNTIEADTSVCFGLPNVVLRGKKATGGDHFYTYKWQTNNFTNWSNGLGTNDQQNYAASNTTSQLYRRIVYSNICSDTSDVDTVIVYPKISGNLLAPSSQMICYNYIPQPIKGAGVLGGGNNIYSYKWEKSEIDSTSSQTAGGIQNNFAPGKLITKTYYRRIVMSGFNNTCKDTTRWVQIQITPAINHATNTIAASQTKCQYIIPDAFTGSAPSGGNNSYKYQWEKSLNLTNWDSINASTELQNYGHSALTATTHFRRIVWSGSNYCCLDTSNIVTITVQPVISNNKIKSGPDTICYNQKPSNLVQNAGVVGGGNGTNYTYTWQEKTITGNWTDITGTNNTSYQPGYLTQTMQYRRKVNSGVCEHFSDTLKINVLEALVGNTISGNHEVCRDLSASELIGGNISKGDGIYRYSWQDSISGGAWAAISMLSPNYSPGVLAVSKYFRRVVKSGENDCCVSKSDPFEIKINELPVGSLIAMDTAICQGNFLNVRASTTGNAPFEINLKGKTDQYNFTNLQLATNLLYFKPLGLKDTVVIESIKDSKGCYAKIKSGIAKIRLVTVPLANAGSNDSICGSVYHLHAAYTPGINNPSGMWRFKTTTGTFSPSESNPEAIVNSSTYGKQWLMWREINEMCSDSAEIGVIFYKQPLKPLLGKDTALYYSSGYQLNAPIPEVGKGLWTTIGNATLAESTKPTTTAENMAFGANEFVWTVTNGVCNPASDSIIVFRDDIKRYTGFSPNGDGENETFVIDGIGSATSKKLKILNRWGNVVYSNDNYDNSWKGENNKGNILPDDTYFYILILDNKREYKGFVVLKR